MRTENGSREVARTEGPVIAVLSATSLNNVGYSTSKDLTVLGDL